MHHQAHTSTDYDRRFRLLKDKLLLMSYQAEQMIADTIRALVSRRCDLAEQVISRDDTLDRLEIEIDTLCHEIVTFDQPGSRDLRFVTTALKIVRDVERIGDIAAHIAHRTIELLHEPELKKLIALPLMGDAAEAILRKSLDAFVNGDADLAEAVVFSDRMIDDMFEEILRELLAYMFEDARTVARALKLVLIAKSLERVGDHAANIAEMVVVLVRGQDIPQRQVAMGGQTA
jgi:phosphate transport system protein